VYKVVVARVELEVAVEPRPGACVIRVSGPVDHSQYYKLEEAIQSQLDRKTLSLVVDLTRLTAIVSAGINTLGHAAAQYEKIGGKICFVRPSDGARWRFFTTVGVDHLLPWAGSLEEALAAVSSP
jgi:anti-anti-sigma factor